MLIAQQPAIASKPITKQFQSARAAIVIAVLGLATRIWAASGTFLNPDEALHFRLANQLSLSAAYKASLTASHPPLLTFILYFWRAAGKSELWLRMPLILASMVFCWMFYRWLTKMAGGLAGFVGLLFVAFLPPVIQLSIEIRQYPLLLAFLASSIYFLDDAFARSSAGKMAVFSLCLCGAMFSHYSAFLFTAALGIYAVIRIFRERPPTGLVSIWIAGQCTDLALAIFLYKTHISKLGVGESRGAMQGWMSEFFLRRSYFDPTRDNPFVFVIGHSFGVFQYFFGQLAVGDIMGIVFLVGIALLLRGKDFPNTAAARWLAMMLVLPFFVVAGASLAHVYPYGGTRHIAFLLIPAVAGVSVAIAHLCGERRSLGIGIAALIILICVVFGKTRPPRMERTDQSRRHMADALAFLRQHAEGSEIIFTDYQSDLLLGHYLCRQRPISFGPAPAGFEQFSCGGQRVISTDYKEWQFWADNFPEEYRRLVQSYKLEPGTTVWVFQAGWGVALPEDLRQHLSEFQNLDFEKFGNNIKVFKSHVGVNGGAETASVHNQ
jgi:hypothetical protein